MVLQYQKISKKNTEVSVISTVFWENSQFIKISIYNLFTEVNLSILGNKFLNSAEKQIKRV